jgi:hypothetical protein
MSDATKPEDDGSCKTCGSVRGANISWTGRETVHYDSNMDEKMCCDLCFSKKDCGGWVFNYDGNCYSKYITPGVEFPKSIADRLDERKESDCDDGKCWGSAGLIKHCAAVPEAAFLI